jgi:hypothetical protein
METTIKFAESVIYIHMLTGENQVNCIATHNTQNRCNSHSLSSKDVVQGLGLGFMIQS